MTRTLFAVATPMHMIAPVKAGTDRVVWVMNNIQTIPAKAAGSAGGQGLQIDRAVGRAGDSVAMVEVAVIDDTLSFVEPQAEGATGFEDSADRLEDSVLKNVSVDLSADARR